MRRHRFALLALIASACARQPAGTPALPTGVSPVVSGNVEDREQTADQQVRHALSRLTFGPRPGDPERVRAMGVDRWIATQLDPSSIPDDSVERVLTVLRTTRMSPRELIEAYPPPQLLRQDLRRDSVPTAEDSVAYREAVRASQRIVGELMAARMVRATASERQLNEVMVDFWHNHFSVFIGKGQPMRYVLGAYDRDVIRPHALGRFRDLLGAVARSDAMLFYLDNWQSVADSGRVTLAEASRPVRPGGRRRDVRNRPSPMPLPAPPGGQRRRRGLNENYARELLELHTLGVDGGYTQADVIDVARAFTGWSLRDPRRGGGYVFRAEAHDAEPKTVLGHSLASGRGEADGEQVLDIVARHPATARFIATKLARRFVSDTPPATLVDRAAAEFTRTDGNIREVVRVIVTSPEFFSAAAYRSKVKTPLELVASTARALNAAPDPSPRMALMVGRLGQPLWGHQAPNGWPETAEAWINTGSILNRINFGTFAAAGPGGSRAAWPFPDSLGRASREAQVDAVVSALLGGDVSPDTRAVLLSGENPLARSLAGRREGADTLASAATAMDESDLEGPRRGRRDPGRIPELRGMALLVGLAIGSPEFQRR